MHEVSAWNLVSLLLSKALSLPSLPDTAGTVVPTPSFTMYMLFMIRITEPSKEFTFSFLM